MKWGTFRESDVPLCFAISIYRCSGSAHHRAGRDAPGSSVAHSSARPGCHPLQPPARPAGQPRRRPSRPPRPQPRHPRPPPPPPNTLVPAGCSAMQGVGPLSSYCATAYLEIRLWWPAQHSATIRLTFTGRQVVPSRCSPAVCHKAGQRHRCCITPMRWRHFNSSADACAVVPAVTCQCVASK